MPSVSYGHPIRPAYKRLKEGTSPRPSADGKCTAVGARGLVLRPAELAMLLDGIELAMCTTQALPTTQASKGVIPRHLFGKIIDHWRYRAGIVRAGCWEHARRHFYDARDSAAGPVAEALARIGRLYAIEKELKETLAQRELTGLAADAVRLAVRQERRQAPGQPTPGTDSGAESRREGCSKAST